MVDEQRLKTYSEPRRFHQRCRLPSLYPNPTSQLIAQKNRIRLWKSSSGGWRRHPSTPISWTQAIRQAALLSYDECQTTSWARSGNGSECDENEERRELHAGVMVDERASKDPGARVIDGFSLSANTAVRLFVASSGLSISNATSA